MIRISLTYIYNMAAQLEPLGELAQEDTIFSLLAMKFHSAKAALDSFESSLFRPYLRTSSANFAALHGLLNDQIKNQDYSRTVNAYEIFNIKWAFQQFRTTLQAELGIFDAYFVTQKGGYDSLSLLMCGENCFPDDLRTKAPEAIFDAREAGKSLAYELPTAVGFHVFRATESVLRRAITRT